MEYEQLACTAKGDSLLVRIVAMQMKDEITLDAGAGEIRVREDRNYELFNGMIFSSHFFESEFQQLIFVHRCVEF